MYFPIPTGKSELEKLREMGLPPPPSNPSKMTQAEVREFTETSARFFDNVMFVDQGRLRETRTAPFKKIPPAGSNFQRTSVEPNKTFVSLFANMQPHVKLSKFQEEQRSLLNELPPDVYGSTLFAKPPTSVGNHGVNEYGTLVGSQSEQPRRSLSVFNLVPDGVMCYYLTQSAVNFASPPPRPSGLPQGFPTSEPTSHVQQ